MHTTHNAESEARHSERGNSLVEYVLLMALIAIVCVAALTYFGSTSGNSIVKSSCRITGAGGATDPTC